MKAAAVVARITIPAAYGAADNDVQVLDLLFDGKYHKLLLFLRGGKFGITVSTEHPFDALVRINIFYAAAMQDMAVRIGCSACVCQQYDHIILYRTNFVKKISAYSLPQSDRRIVCSAADLYISARLIAVFIFIPVLRSVFSIAKPPLSERL